MCSHSLKIMALHERNETLGHKLTETGKAHSQLWFVNPTVCIYNPLHKEHILHKCTFYSNRTYHSKYALQRRVPTPLLNSDV